MRPHARAVGPSILWTAAATAALTLGAPPPAARACGGFFCNQPNGPNELPVAQTAENVLFAMDRAPSGQFALEAHVQIFYTGPADRFSWVVPVDSKPELGVGSNVLFNVLLGATQPRFEVEWREVGTCKPGSPAPPMAAPAPTPGAGFPDASSPRDAGGVDVSFRGNVGPYDAAVIRSTDRNDPKPLIDWLNLNMYFVTDAAVRLIEEYVRTDKWFVAIRLQSEKGVSEIQPLVMRFLGPGPCVPLKLTSIAAIRDLRVNLWVLADGRVVPDNFYEMEINPARINWFRQGNNYEELVKRAADEAGGNAFLTEFAGPAALLKDRLYLPGRYNLDTVARAATPPDALDRIGEMGFPRDNTLLIVLRKHIPVPQVLKAMGIDERTFFNQLRFYWGQYQQQFAPFDARALAADLEATYVTPLKQAQELFDRHARLTRLATFISPEEMNVDPTFVVNDNLPDVPALRTAVANVICGDRQHTACTAPVRLEVPGTDPIWFLPRPQPYCYGRSFDYDRANLDAMPALYRAWQRTDIGEGVARMDRRDAIGSAIRSHNDAAASSTPLPPVPMSPVPGLSPPGSTPPLSPVGGLGPGAPPAPTPTPLTPSGGGGCSCRTAGADDRAPGPLPLALFLLPLARRLRRRRPPERIQR